MGFSCKLFSRRGSVFRVATQALYAANRPAVSREGAAGGRFACSAWQPPSPFLPEAANVSFGCNCFRAPECIIMPTIFYKFTLNLPSIPVAYFLVLARIIPAPVSFISCALFCPRRGARFVRSAHLFFAHLHLQTLWNRAFTSQFPIHVKICAHPANSHFGTQRAKPHVAQANSQSLPRYLMASLSPLESRLPRAILARGPLLPWLIGGSPWLR